MRKEIAILIIVVLALGCVNAPDIKSIQKQKVIVGDILKIDANWSLGINSVDTYKKSATIEFYRNKTKMNKSFVEGESVLLDNRINITLDSIEDKTANLIINNVSENE